MNTKWKKLPFTEVIDDVTRGNVKTLQREFKASGSFPIVDQGKALIAGYTDDKTRLCKAQLPVIVFGDHTKCLKFIDFPFCLGADGTKILKPKIEADEKYLYHFLQTAHIPESGYSRHFKYLKEAEITLPPIEDQRRIAAILDQADNLRRQRQECISKLTKLEQSYFYELFGDPTTNPKGFPQGTIRELMEDVRYGTSKKAHVEKRGIPILRMGNVTYEGQLDLDDLKYIELEEKDFSKWTVEKDDLIFNRTNSKELVGKTAVYGLEAPMALAGYLVRGRTNENGDPYYVSGYLNSPHGKTTLRNMCKNIVGMANINAQEFQSISILVPPIETQKRYRRLIEQVSVQRDTLRHSFTKLNDLFLSLQQRAFNGEL
ncbi:MAG: restriction endonuclease subunit S [Candidatus Thiodiazotropha sp.]